MLRARQHDHQPQRDEREDHQQIHDGERVACVAWASRAMRVTRVKASPAPPGVAAGHELAAAGRGEMHRQTLHTQLLSGGCCVAARERDELVPPARRIASTSANAVVGPRDASSHHVRLRRMRVV
jgi:hypothetical protein